MAKKSRLFWGLAISLLVIVVAVPGCNSITGIGIRTATPVVIEPTETLPPTVTSTSKPTFTLTPTLTRTATLTATHTPTPAPNVGEVAVNLGLQQGREYTIQGNNLIDTQSSLQMAVKEISGWRLTTDEERYGKLADSLDMPVFAHGPAFGGPVHPNDQRYLQIDLNVVFTGYIDVVDWIYPKTGKAIKDYRGLVTYRDGDGSIKKFWVSMFSPDIPGKIYFRYGYSNGGSGLAGVTVEEALQLYQAGQKWNIQFVYQSPDIGLIPETCNVIDGLCTEEYNRLSYLYWQQRKNVAVFANSWLDDDKKTSTVPDDMVIAPVSLEVWAKDS